MSSYGITTADLAARWRPLEQAEGDINEVAYAELTIVDAEDYLDMQFPKLLEAWAPGTRLARVVRTTVCEMVKRVMRNPEALKQQSVEDVQQSFAGPEYDGRLYLTADEFSTLGTAISDALGDATSNAGAFSFNPALNRRRSSEHPVSVLRPR